MQKSTNIKRNVAIVCLIIILICVFSERVHAQDNDTVCLYYYGVEANGASDILNIEEYSFIGYFTQEQKALIIFDNLCSNNDSDKIKFIPEGTEVIDIKIKNDIMILNMTNNMLNYGGTSYENAMLRQIALNASNFKGVKKITIMFDGDYSALPEGKFIFEYEIGELLK